jgi:hypothetical protein
MRIHHLPTILVLLCSGLPSQRTVVLPRNFDTVLPFAFGEWACSGWGHVQNVFYVDPAASGTVTAIALRRHFDPTNTIDTPARTVELDLHMAHSRRDAAATSTLFAENRDTDFRNVMRRRVLNLPRVPGQTQGPYPFSFRLPLDTPFGLTANRWALWEAHVYAFNNCSGHPWAHNPEVAGHYQGTPHPITHFGQNCQSPMHNRLDVGQQLLGLRNNIYLTPEIPSNPNDIPVLFLGTRSDVWFGLPLPVDLASIGAPGCFVHISLDYLWPQPMTLYSPGRSAFFMFEVPNERRLLNADLYFQGARFGSPSNRAGIVTSQGVHTRIGPAPVTEGAIIVAAAWMNSTGAYGQKLWSFSYVTEIGLQ